MERLCNNNTTRTNQTYVWNLNKRQAVWGFEERARGSIIKYKAKYYKVI